VISGWRKERADSFLVRRLPSQTANRLLAQITGVPLHDFGCTLKAYRASFIRRVTLYADMHRFIPGLAAAVGARVGEREVAHHPRRQGHSKYGLGRTYKLLTDMVVLRMLVRFAGQPLHYFGLLSIGLTLLLRFVHLSDLQLADVAPETRGLPVHIHIAEQTVEVEQCLSVLGARPVDWLLDHFAVDRNWPY
jgi:hypothetical protein